MFKVEKIRISGSGGQGAQLLGNIILYGGNELGKNVSFLPSYGPESRGGTSNCHVIVADGIDIGSPVVDQPNILIAMNLPSLRKFENLVSEDGIIIYDTTLIDEKPERENLRIIGIPASEIATRLGNTKSSNMVLLGSYLAVSSLITRDIIIDKVFPKLFTGEKSKFIPINKKALEEGFNFTKKQL